MQIRSTHQMYPAGSNAVCSRMQACAMAADSCARLSGQDALREPPSYLGTLVGHL